MTATGAKNKHVKRRYVLRAQIGEVLRDADSFMTAKQIRDKMAETRRGRKYLGSATSLSTMLRGARGLQVYRDGHKPKQFKMQNFDKYIAWAAGPKFDPDKWHGKV